MYTAEEEAALGSMRRSMRDLLNDPTYSDLTVTCGGRTWAVHKAIVCSRSKWFEKACKVPMKEAQSGIIDIKEVEPNVVQALLHYLYTFEYRCFGYESDMPSVIFDVHVHIAADQFNLPELREMVADSFGVCARMNRVYASEAFARAVELVYNYDPDHYGDMSNHVLTTVSDNLEELSSSASCNAFREITSAIPAFNADLLVRLGAEQAASPGRRTCETCKKRFNVPSYKYGERWFCVFCGTQTTEDSEDDDDLYD